MTDNASNPSNQEPDTGVIRLENAESFAQHSCDMLPSVVRTVNILSTDLERPWLGDAAVVDAVKKAVISNRRVRVRILLCDPKLAIKSQHPLLPLIKRLSRIEARVIDESILDKEPLKQTFMLIDRSRLVVRQVQDQFIGFAHYDDQHSVKNLTETFDQYWRYSSPHPDLRFVHL